MVLGRERLRKTLKAVPPRMLGAARAQLEKEAEAMVAQMRALSDVDGMEFGWTDGAVPRGAFAVAKAKSGGVTITIWARHRSGNAAWFEFGTFERFHKSGKSVGSIAASPVFYPVYRSRRAGVKRRVAKAIRDEFAKG